jgi:hypothetical protein
MFTVVLTMNDKQLSITIAQVALFLLAVKKVRERERKKISS